MATGYMPKGRTRYYPAYARELTPEERRKPVRLPYHGALTKPVFILRPFNSEIAARFWLIENIYNRPDRILGSQRVISILPKDRT